MPAATGEVRLLAYESLPRPAPVLPELGPGDPIAIMYTSGTTGNAKGVVLPHNYYLHFGEQKARHMRTTVADRIYNVYPMFNASGQCEAIMAAMAVGASVYTAPRFSASSFWDDIRTQGCTEFVYMGGILSILAKAEPTPRDRTTRSVPPTASRRPRTCTATSRRGSGSSSSSCTGRRSEHRHLQRLRRTPRRVVWPADVGLRDPHRRRRRQRRARR